MAGFYGALTCVAFLGLPISYWTQGCLVSSLKGEIIRGAPLLRNLISGLKLSCMRDEAPREESKGFPH